MTPRVQIYYFSLWAESLLQASVYLEKLPSLDIKPLVADPTDKALLQLAQLDCDWDGENLRCYSQLSHPELQFEPAKIVGILGLQELVEEEVEPDVTPWLVMISQHPHKIEPVIDRILTLFTRKGGKVFYWAYDEASRYMPSFARVAKYLNILVHDEMPLDQAASASLNPTCITLHSSPLANMIPYAHPFIEDVNKQIVFLCSSMGLTGHRKKQVDHLQKHFKDRFLAIYDHSIPMNQRGGWQSTKHTYALREEPLPPRQCATPIPTGHSGAVAWGRYLSLKIPGREEGSRNLLKRSWCCAIHMVTWLL